MGRRYRGALVLVAGLASLALYSAGPPRTASAAPLDTPVQVVSDNVEEWSVGAGLIYWAHNCFADEFNPFAALMRQPSGGGTRRTLVSMEDYAACNTFQNQLSTAEGLYYYDRSHRRIAKMPLGEPFTAQVVKGLEAGQEPNRARALQIVGDYIYWVDMSNKILRISVDGAGPIETVANTGNSPTDVLITAAGVFWADAGGIFQTSVVCGALPCDSARFVEFGPNTFAHGLAYHSTGGALGNYTLHWVQRTFSGANVTAEIRRKSCSLVAACLFNDPQTVYAASLNWHIGRLLIAEGNLYWTEADFNTPSNPNGDVKRRALSATGLGADTIASRQGPIDDRLYAADGTLYYARRGAGIYSLSLSAAAILRDLKADALEVTQAIQNLANGVPLVAGKATYVRLYGTQLSGPSTPNVEVRLRGTRGQQPLPGSPLAPVNGMRALDTGGSYDRSRLNDGWYFLLPASWVSGGPVSLIADIDPRLTHGDPDRSNNQLQASVNFADQPPVCVWTVPVRTHTPLPSINDPNFWDMVSHFYRRWPVPDVWVFPDTSPVEELEVCWYGPLPYPCHGPYELEDGWSITNGIPDRDKVIASLWARALLTFNPDACENIGAPVHFMGLVHPAANNGGAAGYASTVSNQSWVQLPEHAPSPPEKTWKAVREGSVMAQELAHNYGRKHVDCGGPDDVDRGYPYPPCQIGAVGPANHYGFDTSTLEPIRPNGAADFMSYANNQWVSDYTWRALFGAFGTFMQAASETRGAGARPAQSGSSVFVTGVVDTEHRRGDLGMVLIVPTDSLPPATVAGRAATTSGRNAEPQSQPAAAFKLRLLDAVGGVVVERDLALTGLDDHSPHGHSALFSDVFPKPAGQVAKVELTSDGIVVDTWTPGLQVPAVTVSRPTAGEAVANELVVEWTASDADAGDRLHFTVQYSHDQGSSWHTLVANHPGGPGAAQSLRLTEIGSLHGSARDAALIRVIASDGYNSAVDTSPGFTVPDRKPQPVIMAPAQGEVVPAGEAVLLQGTATDAEDGGLSAAALRWAVDGVAAGVGRDVIVAGLAPGVRTVALGAVDSARQVVTETVRVTIAPLSVPMRRAAPPGDVPPPPAMDGGCDDPAYADAARVMLRPYAAGAQAGAQAEVRLIRTGEHLWACFTGLARGPLDSTSFVSLLIDVNHSREAVAQPSDAQFGVGEDGSVWTKAGDGAGGTVAPGPGGLVGQVAGGESTWSAELRIEAERLGGWGHLVGLAAAHHQGPGPTELVGWPYRLAPGGANTWATTALGELPRITAVAPDRVLAGAAMTTVVITGTGFVSGTLAIWNTTALVTTVADDTRLEAEVPAQLLAQPGVAHIKARSPGAAQFESNAVPFVVLAPMPAIDRLEPNTFAAGSGASTLVVHGSGFAPDAQVQWNGISLATTNVGSTELRAQVPAELLVAAQSVGVTVRNPTPSDRVSLVAPLDVMAVSTGWQIYAPFAIRR